MKDKVLLVEPKCPSGHINLYRAQIRKYCEQFDVTLATTPEFFDFFSDLPISYAEIPESQCAWTGKIGYRINQLLRITPLLRHWRTRGFSKCIFLSYDTVSLAAISPFVDMSDVYLFVHNNIDEMQKSRLKRASFRMISKSATFYVFEEYIGAHLRRQYGVNTAVVQHERRKMRRSYPLTIPLVNGHPFVFCPSADCDRQFLLRLIRYCEANGLFLVAKSQSDLPPCPSVITQKYFDNYEDLFLESDFIAVGVDYKYRVSGVFYEALGNDKKIIANDCLFMRAVMEQMNEIPLLL